MTYNKNRMVLFVRVLILRDGKKLYVSFFCLQRGAVWKEDTKIFNLHSFFLPR